MIIWHKPNTYIQKCRPKIARAQPRKFCATSARARAARSQKLSVKLKSSTQLRIVHMVLYIPPTQTKAESTFSFQKWLIGARGVSLTPANCDARVRSRSCKQLKRRIHEVEKEIKIAKKRKLNAWKTIETLPQLNYFDSENSLKIGEFWNILAYASLTSRAQRALRARNLFLRASWVCKI